MTSENHRIVLRILALCIGLTLLLGACAPAGQGSGRGETTSAASTPKTLRVGIINDAEPKEFGVAFGTLSAGASEPRYLLHAPLTIFDDSGVLQPRIVERVPTIENGDWQMLPDGKMELTWKLRPDVRWHDGQPLTAEDIVLGFKIAIDPEFSLGTSVLRQMSEVSARDPLTLVVGWRNVYIYADDMGLNTLVPIPSHRIASAYEAGDKVAFAASPAWGDQWIGLGPYKMGEWQRGSYIDVVANDDYFLGRPKVDRISLRYFGDTRSLIVATMAGHIDVVTVGSMKSEEAHVLKTEWEAAGNGAVVISANKLRNGDFSWRDPTAPWATDVRVRRAMTHLLDRESMVETLHNGLASVDDIMLPRSSPSYRLAQQKGLPRLNYDVAQAGRLLADAGLIRGSDGVYRTPAGTPFSVELNTTSDINTNVQELQVIASAWKTAGIESTAVYISGAMDKDAIRGQSQGITLTSTALGYRAFDSYITSEISSESTRWKGSNIGGYSNASYDDLNRRLLRTLSTDDRTPLAAELVKMQLDEMMYMPLVYSVDVSANSKSVRGITQVLPAQRINAWNVHLWEMD